MKKMKVDLAVIGGGPAGMAAALEAKRQGEEIRNSAAFYNSVSTTVLESSVLGKDLREQNMRSVLSTRSKRAILRCF